MRRMCGLSSQTRKRSLLKSMRNMTPGPVRSTFVNHIAPGVNEGLPSDARAGGSVAELLAQNTLFQAVAWVEQHAHRDGPVGQDLDAPDPADLLMVGDRRDGALVVFQDFDHDIGGVGQQGAAPAPR